MALMRFGGLRDGRMTDIGTIARHFQRDPAVVSRAISSAFRQGLVEVTRTPRPAWGLQRVSALEEQLLARYPDLSAVVVVEASPPPAADPDDDSNLLAYGDSIHQQLGQAMAQLLTAGTLIRSNERLCLGSGRGVYFTIDAMDQLPPIRAHDLRLYSLTGVVYPRVHGGATKLRLDADTHVNLFLTKCVHEVAIFPISHPIAYKDQHELNQARDRTCLSPTRWIEQQSQPTSDKPVEPFRPEHALVGVGVLARGHRFYEAVERSRDPAHILNPICELLEELVARSDPLTDDTYCPVADIAHRLFFVPPPKGKQEKLLQDSTALRHVIDQINQRLLTVSERQLGSICSVMLVAGTRRKAPAIKALLRKDVFDINIRFLCIDRLTAEDILRSDE